MKIVKQKQVTEEVKKWSIEFMRSVETEGYESMVSKLRELTPELRVGVLVYLQRIIDYCVKNDLKDFLEGVNTYKELVWTKPKIGRDPMFFYEKMCNRGRVSHGKIFKWSGMK